MNNKFYALTATIILSVALCVFLLRKSPVIENSPTYLTKSNIRSDSDQRVDTDGKSRRASVQKIDNLERLKRQWKKLPPPHMGGYTHKSETRSLARESVKLLGCSQDIISLLVYLKINNSSLARLSVETEMVNLFSSSQASEARTGLSNLAHTKISTSYRLQWSYVAGKHCPDEEFDSFCKSLGYPRAVQQAIFGKCETLAKSNPVEATKITLKTLGQDMGSGKDSQSLEKLYTNLPQNTDFQELESLLPAHNKADKSDSAVNQGRRALFQRWAEINPREAADYLMSNPTKTDPQCMSSIAEKFVEKSPHEAVDWVQDLPEGDYFDNAVYGMMTVLARDGSGEATELANRIKNPEIRKESFNQIKMLKAGPEER